MSFVDPVRVDFACPVVVGFVCPVRVGFASSVVVEGDRLGREHRCAGQAG